MMYLIAAMSRNNVIGKDNKLLWDIKEDMQRFKDLTTENVVVMGRKTFTSIGKALPNRDNVVLTTSIQMAALQRGCFTSPSIEHFLEQKSYFEKQGKDIYVIGGEQIYRQFIDMDIVDGIYLTIIDKEYDGDAYFPNIPDELYRLESAEAHQGFTFLYYGKKK